MHFLFLLFCFTSTVVFSLPEHCPKGFLKRNGRCFYTSSYLTQKSSHGLKKGINLLQDGFYPKEIELGKILFFDPVLSKQGDLSCAHCHSPSKGFSDGLKTSRGKVVLSRSAPTLWNVAFLENFFWDGRSKTLENQLAGPLFSENEMGNTPVLLEKSLNEIDTYRKFFYEVYRIKKITYPFVARALATFERTLVSLNSRYDQFVWGKTDALSPLEVEGHNLFRSFVTRCTECHTPPLMTNSQMANIGIPLQGEEAKDIGLEGITSEKRHRYFFKVPTLRNITRTAPYMHTGVFSNLYDVVQFYNAGGGRVEGGSSSPFIHWHIRKIGLTTQEENQLVAFLGSLEDESNAPEIPLTVPSGLKPITKEELP